MSYMIVHMPTPNLGRFELAVLLSVARIGDDAFGLAVQRDLVARTDRDPAIGAVYTTLQRLEDKGLLRSRMSEPQPVRGGRSRRLYTLTGVGRRALVAAERNAAALWAGVERTLSPRHS